MKFDAVVCAARVGKLVRRRGWHADNAINGTAHNGFLDITVVSIDDMRRDDWEIVDARLKLTDISYGERSAHITCTCGKSVTVRFEFE